MRRVKRLAKTWGLILLTIISCTAAGFAWVQHRNNQPIGAAKLFAVASRDIWLSDFEVVGEESTRWALEDATAETGSEHATHGTQAVKVTFRGGTQSPAIVMNDFLARDMVLRDWSRYGMLSFDIYNPQPTSERLLLQVKNSDGALYKEEFVIPAESSQHAEVNLRDAVSYLSLSDVEELRLFQWQPGRNITLYLDAFQLLTAAAPADPAHGPVREIAPEPAPSPIEPAAHWRLGWTSGLAKVFRDPAMFRGSQEGPIRMSLARGEYESAQLVLIGGAKPAQVSVAVGPIAQPGGAAIPAGVVEVRRVDYVKTVKPFYPVTHVGDWPDALPEASAMEIPARQIQPVWITIGAPDSLPAGRYQGTVTVTDSDGRAESIALEVTVWNFTLPRTGHLKTAFDLYPNRLERAYAEFVPGGAQWAGRMDELRDRYMLSMLKHRISPVWGADPTTQRFAWEVKRYLDRGMTAFGVGSHGGSHGNNWPKDPLALEQLMPFYRQAALELSLTNLRDQAYVYAFDEPNPDDPLALAVMEKIHHEAPGLKNLLVMNQAPDPVKHAAWLKAVDILCLRITVFDPEHVERFRATGKELWMYVSMPVHPFPSLNIDYPAISHRILPWMAWKYQVSGLLYWCVNFWEGDPMANPQAFEAGQNGNGILYYPGIDGPIPSIRLEALRDGLEDYEYLVLLQRLLQAAKNRPGADPAKLQFAERLLAVDPVLVTSLRSYAKDPQVLDSQRRQIAEMIEYLQPLGTAY